MRYIKVVLVLGISLSQAQDCTQAQDSYRQSFKSCGYTPRTWCMDTSCQINNQLWCNATQCTTTLNLAKNIPKECLTKIDFPLNICESSCLTTIRSIQILNSVCYNALQTPSLENCHACQQSYTNRTRMISQCGVTELSGWEREYKRELGSAILLCQSTYRQQLPDNFPFDNTLTVNQKTSLIESNSQVFVIVVIVGLIVTVSVMILVYFQYRKCRAIKHRVSCQLYHHHPTHQRASRFQRGSTGKHNRTSILSFEDEAPYVLPSPEDYRVVLSTPKSSVIEDVRFDKKFTQFRIPLDDFMYKTSLQTGGQAKLYRAQWKGRDVAIKQISPMHAKDFDALQEFMREIRLSAYFRHSNIVEFLGIAWQTLKDISIVTEYMVHGDLNAVLRVQRDYPAEQQWLQWYAGEVFPSNRAPDDIHLGFDNRVNTSKLSIALQIMEAIVYLHSMSVVHRDIKSKNVVLNSLYTAKLCDFGISRRISDLMTANRGTIAYMAPEVFQGNKYTEKADIYSFGVFLSEMDKLDSPYVGDMEDIDPGVTFPEAKIALMVAEGRLRPTFTKAMPQEILILAHKCLTFDASARPTAVQVEEEIKELLRNQNLSQN